MPTTHIDPHVGHQPRPSRDRAAGRAAALALTATSLGFGVVQLDVSVVNVAVRTIGTDFDGSVSALQWVVNGYTVAFASLILTAGALGDRIGAKRVFVTGFALFTVASAACAVAPDLLVLIGARAVQGIGASILVPCSLTLLNHAYPEPSARARAVGIWAAGASVGLSGGPLVGGALTAAFGWRAIFLINVPLGVVAIWLTLRFATETTRSRQLGVDAPGQVLAGLSLLLLAAAVVQGGRSSFGNPVVLAGLGAAACMLAAFVLVERARRDPMLPLVLFRSRTFAAASAIGFAINVAFYGLIFVLSLYFQTAHDYSPLRTGLALAPATAVVLAANLLAGRLTRRVGVRVVLCASASIVALSLLALLVAGPRTSYAAIAVQLITLGFALGLIVPTMTSALLGSVDRARSGVASGTLNTARQTGSVLGVALFGSLAARSLVPGLHTSLIIGAVLALLCAGLGLVVEG